MFFFLKKTRIPVAPKEYKILIERHGSHYTPWKCKSTAPAHLARYCPKTPPQGEREGKKSHNQPSDLSPRHDFWLMMIYEILLIVTACLIISEMTSIYPLLVTASSMKKLRVNFISSPIYSFILHFGPYTFPFHLSPMPPKSSNTVLEEWRPTIIFSHFFSCPFLSIVFSLKSPWYFPRKKALNIRKRYLN